MSNVTSAQVIEIPVNMNGTLRVSIPSNMCAEQVQELALARFKRMLHEELRLGEVGDAHCQFDGAVWGTEGQAQVGDLMFEVQHDMDLNVSGASVALRPRDGEFGQTVTAARFAHTSLSMRSISRQQTHQPALNESSSQRGWRAVT